MPRVMGTKMPLYYFRWHMRRWHLSPEAKAYLNAMNNVPGSMLHIYESM